jgi:hypothetical protein
MSVEWHLLSAEFANHPLVAEGSDKANCIQPAANDGDGFPEPMRWTIESYTSDSTQHRGSYSQHESTAQWEPRLPMYPFGAPSLHALNFLPSRST